MKLITILKLTAILCLLAVDTFATEAVVTVTAYCGCAKCNGKWAQYHKTADGHTPKQGITCAASRNIPFGTKIKIEGVGIRIVQDRLAQRFDSRLDVYFSSHTEALRFGKKQLKISY